MYIVAIAWIYVVFMMSITEHSLVAGVMTFLLYGLLPLAIILYVMGTGQRRRRRAMNEKPQNRIHSLSQGETESAHSNSEPGK